MIRLGQLDSQMALNKPRGISPSNLLRTPPLPHLRHSGFLAIHSNNALILIVKVLKGVRCELSPIRWEKLSLSKVIVEQISKLCRCRGKQVTPYTCRPMWVTGSLCNRPVQSPSASRILLQYTLQVSGHFWRQILASNRSLGTLELKVSFSNIVCLDTFCHPWTLRYIVPT